MRRIAFLFPVALCLSFGPAFADDKPIVVPDSAAAQAADCHEGMSDCKLECKHMAPPTGTRLGGHTECRTHKYWDDKMRADQATTATMQNKSYDKVQPGMGD